MPTTAISITNLQVSYPNQQEVALKIAELKIPTKQISLIIGPNGAGKSTLIKAILGLVDYQGFIEVFEKKNTSAFLEIGFVPQRYSINQDMPVTVSEFLNLVLTKCHHSQTEKQSMIFRALEKVNLTQEKDNQVRSMSGGQLQRLLFARAIVHQPRLLILDEPETGVDFTNEASMYDTLQELKQTEGMTILISSHELDLVSKLADRVVCLNKSLICSGSPKAVLSDQTLREMYGYDVSLYGHAH